MSERAMIQIDEHGRRVNECVRALCEATRALLECELAYKAHPESSITHSRKRGEEALAAIGVTWHQTRGWMTEPPMTANKPSFQEESRVAVGGVELPELPHPEGADVFGADYTAEQMRAFYAAGVKAERERCAKICEEIEKRYLDAWKSNARDPSDFVQGQSDGAGECGTAIRKQNPPA
jgi:hypothetical protein